MNTRTKSSATFYRRIVQAKDNKLVVYLVTRYMTYFIKFLTSLLLANKLGPTNYGIWGYILLLISYFGMINFGLSNSMNIILVQNRDNNNVQNEYIKNDMLLVTILGCFIMTLLLVYVCTGMSWFSKYTISYEFLIICIIAILAHFNTNLVNISRVKNDFYRIAFNQSIIPILSFICVLFFDDRSLLMALLLTSLIGNSVSLFVFLYHKSFSFSGNISKEKCKQIVSKGWWLFIYNLFFYLILVSTRTLITRFYSIEDFGFFSFSFTLGDAVLLLFQAVSNVVFPKVLAKLGDKGANKKNTIKLIDSTYVMAAYFAVLFVCCLFPVILLLFPEYQSCNVCMSLVAITMALYTNSYAYTSYLMINNKERLLAGVALFCLAVNVLLALLIINVLKMPYSYVILSTMISYCLFYVLCAKFVQRIAKEKISVLNWRLHIPTLCALILTVSGLGKYVFVALLFFVIVNQQNVKSFFSFVRAIWKDYRIINV